MKTKNGHILTFSEKMQISAILCFATCDWFCPMTSQICLALLQKGEKQCLIDLICGDPAIESNILGSDKLGEFYLRFGQHF